MKKILFGISICCCMAACKKSSSDNGDTPPPGGNTQADIATVDNNVTNFMKTYNIPGASLAVSRNGKLVYIKGYGYADVAANTKVTPQSRFRLASCSKTYTGVAMLKLIQEGKLSLTAKVFGSAGVLGTTYGSQPYSANVSNITVRDLLQEISGGWGASSGGDPIDLNPAMDNPTFFTWVLNNKPVLNPPGTVYDYSNMNFFIAGRIIEKISGKPYINYIKEDLLASIGETQTDIAGKTEAETKTNEVKYYGQNADAAYVYNIAFPRRDADAGIITTATGLLRLVTAIDGSATRPDVLNATSLGLLTTPSAVYSSYACGIGIWASENVWYNYGSLPGTRTGFMRNANGMCVSLLLNSRIDPTTNETPFIYAMQDLMLDITKNTSYPWQNIDQF